MKNLLISFVLAMSAGIVGAANPISNVTMEQRSDGKMLVSYTLSRDSIVTVDFVREGVSIGTENFTALQGDVSRYVPAGPRSFLWNPRRTPIAATEEVLRNVRPVLTAWDPASPPDYMVVDLVQTASAKYDNRTYYSSPDFVPGGVTNNPAYISTKLLMRRIPAAGVEWLMGAAANEPFYSQSLECRRRVVLSQDYYMAVFPITQAQAFNAFGLNMVSESGFPTVEERDASPRGGFRWKDLRGPSDGTTTPAEPSDDSHLGKLRTRVKVDFDLPTSAQWEFACRAGTHGETYVTDSSDFTYAVTGSGSSREPDEATKGRLGTISWNYWNSTAADASGEQKRRMHAVGRKLPNAFGLYDMFGNAWELCLDYYVSGESLLASFGDGGFSRPIVDPCVLTKLSSSDRIRRGSCATESAAKTTLLASRAVSVPESETWCGARVVCPLN